eukprot:TRINITY_DN5954_c0_g2_i1.p1 TRINITY_DN5954_c0_g2~~TRINITY_DN5954_c0_g2_i1.p1  ORF type:complete len:461 (+),score=33.86 TRINITY_DN5954_c0_g2_i1:56-1438(+)
MSSFPVLTQQLQSFIVFIFILSCWPCYVFALDFKRARLPFRDSSVSKNPNIVIIPLRARTGFLRPPGNPVSEAQRMTVYYSIISVGEPAQNFSVLFDTGSNYLWIPSVTCQQASCQGHHRYNQSVSSTYHELDPQVDMATSYASGDLKGGLILERVCLSIRAVDSLSAEGLSSPSNAGSPGACVTMKVSSAYEESEFPFSTLPFDGILGLAPPPTRPRPSGGYMTQEWLKQLDFSVATVRLRPVHGVGESFAGDIALARSLSLLPYADGHVQWAAQVPEDEETRQNFWRLRLLSVRVDDTPVQICHNESWTDFGDIRDGCSAIVDTGASWMMGPTLAVDDMLSSTAPQLEQDCSRTVGLPTWSFDMLGVDGPFTLTLEPEEYLDPRENGKCTPALAPMEIPPGLPEIWVLGQQILRKYNTYYDFSERKVGFSRPAAPVGSRETTPLSAASVSASVAVHVV